MIPNSALFKYLTTHIFSIQYSLGSDKISNLEEPLLRLSCATMEGGDEFRNSNTNEGSNNKKPLSCSTTKMLEFNINDLDKFITSLEDIEKQLRDIET